MFQIGIVRHALMGAALVFFVATLHAALPNAADTPRHDSLSGQLLIAAPNMPDPRFSQTVILMVRHDKDGALGIVINRPLQERSLASLLQALGSAETAATGSIRIFAGGPVQPDIGFVVHSTDYRRPETLEIDARVAMTSSREILLDIARNRGPKQSLVAFGYAGWCAGQLEGELERRSWFTAPDDPSLIFEQDRAKVWDEAMKRRTQDL